MSLRYLPSTCPGKILAFILSLLTAWTPVALALDGELPQTLDSESTKSKFDKIFQSAREVRTNLDQTRFSVEAVLDATDYEPEEIIRFVREEIAFEQYPGTLRGPKGTVISRAGNSLDQALLLAKLLRDAGYDARIARTQLDIAQATRLLNETFQTRKLEKTEDLGEVVTAAFKSAGILDLVDDPMQALLAEQPDTNSPETFTGFNEVLQTTGKLESLLTKSGALKDSGISSVIEEARDYFWVQYREMSAEDWADLHVAFRSDPKIEVAPIEHYNDTIPEELQHRFRIQVFNEVSKGGRLSVIPITSPWERPTANLNGVPLVFSNVPDNIAHAPRLSFSPIDAISQSNFFIPVFQGRPAPGGQYFDTRGNKVDAMAASNAAAGLFQALGELVAQSSEALSSGSAPVLTAQWIEITLISPGGSERSYKRTTLDRIGPAARSEGRIPPNLGTHEINEFLPLLQTHSIMLATGAIQPSFAIDQGFQQLLETEPLIRVLVRHIAGESVEFKNLSKQLENVPTAWAGHLPLFTRLDLASQIDSEVQTYRHAPTLIIHRKGLTPEGTSIQGIDIVQNPRRALTEQNGTLAFDARSIIKSGVWDTAMEDAFLSGEGKRTNTAIALAKANLQVISNATELEALALSEDTKASMLIDLEAGNILVAADQLKTGDPGWWKIDVESGIALGQIQDGRGSVTTEFLVVVSLGISIGFLVVGLIGCYKDWDKTSVDVAGESLQLGCCGILNLAFFAMGFMISTLHWTVGAAWDSWFGTLLPNVCEIL